MAFWKLSGLCVLRRLEGLILLNVVDGLGKVRSEKGFWNFAGWRLLLVLRRVVFEV